MIESSEVPGRSFLIVTPCDDGHKLCYWQSIMAFQEAILTGVISTPHRFQILPVHGDSLVPRARNNLAWSFLTHSDADYFFPIDSDLDFRPEDILRMADLVAMHDLDILAGLYAIKEDGLRWCINAIDERGPDAATGLQEIAHAPGGLHIAHRRVFEKMIAEGPPGGRWLLPYLDDHDHKERWDFYWNGVVDDPEFIKNSPRYLSEDWGFSYFCRRLGFKIWLDTKTVMLHRGETFYPRNTKRLSKAEAESGLVTQPDGSITRILPTPGFKELEASRV